MRTRLSHSHNIEVFEDTMNWCRENEKLQKAVQLSIREMEIIPETASVKSYADQSIYDAQAQIIVSSKRSFEAASSYKNQKVCVLNFASAVNPGGGVVHGSNAQEESLCRISTLYPCLSTEEAYQQFYNPHHRNRSDTRKNNDDCIYTPGILVIRKDDFDMERLDESQWFETDVITCAAPDLRGNAIDAEQLYQIHVKRLRRILDLAADKKEEVMILGAFGCGAFGNDPQVVAEAMKEAQSHYLHSFRTIEYAVYCAPYDRENYDIFNRIMNQR